MLLKKRYIKIISCFLVFLLFFIININFVYSAAPGGAEGEEKVNIEQQIQTDIETSISSGSSVDLSQPRYSDNPDVVRKVLREKYNADISSIDGARIDAGKLTLPGGTSIDLTTGRHVVLDSIGANINHMTDGETTVVNAIGVRYDGDSLKVERAAGVRYKNTNSDNVRNYDGTREKITISSAELVVTDGNTLSKVSSVELRRENNQLSLINFICAGNGESVIDGIKIQCQRNKRISADVSGGIVLLTLDKSLEFSYKNIEGTADNESAWFKLKKINLNSDEITTSSTTIKFQKGDVTETIISKSETIFRIDQHEGIYFISLGPGSRFSRTEADESKSFFSLFNFALRALGI